MKKIFQNNKGITLDWLQKIRQKWTWFNKGDIINKVEEERKDMIIDDVKRREENQ